jgi:hypothetical protein
VAAGLVCPAGTDRMRFLSATERVGEQVFPGDRLDQRTTLCAMELSRRFVCRRWNPSCFSLWFCLRAFWNALAVVMAASLPMSCPAESIPNELASVEALLSRHAASHSAVQELSAALPSARRVFEDHLEQPGAMSLLAAHPDSAAAEATARWGHEAIAYPV